MKSVVFKGLFIFSLALNLAIFGTVAWKWSQRSHVFAPGTEGYALSPHQARQIKRQWRAGMGKEMEKGREKVAAKYGKIIDMISSKPNGPDDLDKELDELIKLRGEMERQAILNLKNIFKGLSPDKREAFANFLKRRTCFGHRRPGRGRRGHGRVCPMP